MNSTQRKSGKLDCANLLDELSTLKDQIRQAEDQLKEIEAYKSESILSKPDIKKTSFDNYDLGEVSPHQKVTTESDPSSLSERVCFTEAMLKLTNNGGMKKVESGSLLICEFVASLRKESSSDHLAVSLIERNMFDSIVNSCTRKGVITSYVSHSETAIFIPGDVDGAESVLISEKLIKSIKNYSFSKLVKENQYECKVGIALYPLHSRDIDMLFRYADRALYLSLKIDGSYYSFYL